LVIHSNHPVEHHHRRIRRRAHAILWGLIPLAVGVPLAWLYLSFGVCQETEAPAWLAACRLARGVPLLPGLAGLAVAALIAWELAHLGAHHKKATKTRLSHIGHGYRSLDARHKWHVHLAWSLAVLVAASLVAWALYMRQSIE
jgi:hypothetical protein